MSEPDGVDELYELEPGEFVAARDRLARELKAAGNGEAAAAVKKLRRPTVVAWALNRVARSHADEVDELAEAGAAVREAQAAVVSGGDPGDLRDATHRRRQIISKLAGAATELAGPAHRDEAVATLDAASLDPEGSELLRRGRLAKELPPPAGFGLAGMPEPPPVPVPQHRPEADLEQLHRDLERAEAEVAAAEHEVTRAEERLAAARAEVEAATSELDAAAGRRQRARAALDEASTR